MMEIERKFLLDSLPPEVSACRKIEIEQAYISTDPTIRLRRSDESFVLCVKQGGLAAREETEFTLSREQFERLWKKAETKPVLKTRFIFPLDSSLRAEVDVYHGDLDGLLTVEVEFSSFDEASSFTPPSWFGKDVTMDPKYKNSYLAVFGKPEFSKIGK
ncbi:MAG: CYTH domain-containing protein [Clostridiales bacterium]|jgi:CYTH domain-containing protein|nr:CYTH domain-containing protein [Clostridiales bacterium]